MSNKKFSISRRQAIGAGVVGIAAVATSNRAIANTQKPPAPASGKADANGRFKDKVVLITGATSGIGEATAKAFAKEGAIVHFCGRREALGNKISQEINAQGGRSSYQKADIRNEQEVKAFVDTCVQKYGRIDIAFNNAGIEATAAPLAEQSLENFTNVMTTNAVGYFLSMKYEIPHMLQRGGGVIINNASVSAHDGFALISPYSASKHAIIGLTKCAALEYTPKNIRINSISPGGVDTPMLRRALKGFGITAEQAAAGVPIRRINTVEEMARMVMFLSSNDASSVAGTDIDVTGGMLTA
ncbi:SDR family NAD(P)-dependent oxidoreductase [Aliterella atlantica]|uniref:Short-chain dehydrogenase n=1 Tax=Aliterella atlantica CENA595 TaxID=1618023 RepID=A0A0D8ZRT9_9CYAN|nr:SDR family oxidoreductase [Aliterella atlantica]KJH71523.1 short-chain dehydrogenase [Aliterella atlantica CENA595]